MDGEGFTAVEGKKMPLKRGDVVVTPAWRWHDHGNESQSPFVWLDLLNLPLVPLYACQFCEWLLGSSLPWPVSDYHNNLVSCSTC